MSLLRSPALIAPLAILLGSAAGLWPVWQVGQILVRELLAARITADPHAVTPAQKAQGWDFWTIEIENLSSELKEEKERLAKQAQQLDQRAGRIAAEQQELDKIRTSVEAMRAEIATRVIEIQADELKNLRSLSQTYAALTPRAAVAIIRELDDLTAVKILSLMKADTVGPIFEEMAKTAGPEGPLAKRAAVLSDKLRLMKSTKPAPTSS